MVIHIVMPGETIFQIAQAYGVSLEILMRDNGIVPSYPLVVGQALVIANGPDAPLANPYALINGYAYTYIDEEILRGVLPSLTSITIFGYGFTTTGELIPPRNDERLIAASRSFGVAPIMLIAALNEYENFNSELINYLLVNPDVQDVYINNIINTMIEKGYQGVDVDFEYIDPANREAFVDFLRKLTEKLHQYGYTVNVDVAPKTTGEEAGILYEAHDYQAIGEVVDTVFLMTYEWGYTYGPPMAVAPLPNVRAVLEYAVTVIPREKLLMGIPGYGYDWTLPFIRGESEAIVLGNLQAVQLAANVGAVILFDDVSQTPYYFYTDSAGNAHVVWFEDARSIQAKLRLMKEYQLLGASYWNLMRSFPQKWVVLHSEVQVMKRNL